MSILYRTVLVVILFTLNIDLVLGQSTGIDLEAFIHAEEITDREVDESYRERKQQIAADRERFSTTFKSCKDSLEEEELMDQIRKYLNRSLLEDIIPLWEGTAWNFNGYSRVPRQGSIACGWFVQRALEDLGFQLEKKRSEFPYFAQNWPETMVYGLDPKWARMVESSCGSSGFRDSLLHYPEGVFLIGFGLYKGDKGQHVGFLVKTSQEIYIIHSLGRVEKTLAEENSCFQDATSLYLARLFPGHVLEAWVKNEELGW